MVILVSVFSDEYVGGFISQDKRVDGMLSVTRAFGDAYFKIPFDDSPENHKESLSSKLMLLRNSCLTFLGDSHSRIHYIRSHLKRFLVYLVRWNL